MNPKDKLITALAVLVLGLAGYFTFYYGTKPDQNVCNICSRPIHSGMAFLIQTDGHTEFACCPRCGMHYILNHPGKVQKAWATDLNSGASVPADAAYYNEGGNVEYCAVHRQTTRWQLQSVLVRDYDRCLPTIVAFKTLAAANDYRKRHGGQVLNYAAALENVKEQ